MHTPRTTDRRRERGVAIIWAAFFLLLLLGFVAIGVDVAKAMATRTSLQNAADAAALAGASAVIAETGLTDANLATARAQATSALNKAFVNQAVTVTLLAGDVVVNPTERTVQVTVRRDATTDGAMVTHIAKVLGVTSLDLKATATAKADWADEICEGLTPMAALPPAGGFQYGCGSRTTLFSDGSTNGNYGGVSFPSCDEGVCAGMAPRGANTFGCLLGNGYSCCVGVGTTVDTEPGQMMGKLKAGLTARWNADTDKRTGICHQQYTGNGKRIVFVPIIPELPNGRKAEPVLGFAAFFLLDPPPGGPQNPVTGEFLYVVAAGQGGGPANSGGALSLRLIQ